MSQASVLRVLEASIRDAKGVFVRVTGKGHRRWRIGASHIDLPSHGLDSGRTRANFEAQIRRAAKAAGVTVAAKPPKKESVVEREVAVATPVEVAAEETREATASPEGDRESVTPGDVEIAHADDERSPDVRGDAHVGPASSGRGVLEAEDANDHGRSTTELTCPECAAQGVRRTFAKPMHLGRHRGSAHRVAVAASLRTAPWEAEPVVERRLSWQDAPKPADPVPVAPKAKPEPPRLPSALSSSDLLTRAVAALEAALVAVQEYQTEHRLIMDENRRLRTQMEEMETAFSLIRSKRR